MKQKYIIDDIVEFDNKVMVVKEPINGEPFELFYPKKDRVYCILDVNEIKPVHLTSDILEKNEWKRYRKGFVKRELYLFPEADYFVFDGFETKIKYVHQLQHLLFGLGVDTYMRV